jgi:hypothetical protein
VTGWALALLGCPHAPAIPPAPPPCPELPAYDTWAFRSRTVPFLLVGQARGPEPSVDLPNATGGTVVAAVPELEAELRLRSGWTDEFGSLTARSDRQRYLVTWRRESRVAPAVLDVVWVRPTETLLSFLDRSREDPRPAESRTVAPWTSVQIYLLPPGEYLPVGMVYQQLPTDEAP